MSNLSQITNQHPQLKNLPPECRTQLEQFHNDGDIPADLLPEIKTSLLAAINSQELFSRYSLIDPDRIHYDINELIVWLGVKFSRYIQKEPESLFEPEKKISKRICLVHFDKYDRYDFIWEHDIEDKIKNHKDIIDIKIIKNYKKMLPLVKNFKETMQQKIGVLPYLGTKNDHGNWFLLDKEIFRPDYSRIKAEPLISLEDSLCILLGIDDFDLIVSINNHMDYITEEQDRYIWEDDFYALPLVPADNPFRDVIATAKYREAWRDIISFVKDLVKKIIRNSKTGVIDLVNYNTLMGNHFALHDIKSHKYYFETFSFLYWAKKDGYKIPSELHFIKNAHGTYKWLSSNTDHVKQDIERSLDDLLIKAREEVDMLYDKLKGVMKDQGKDLYQANCEDTIKAFSKSNQNYSILTQEDINNEINFNGNKPARDIKGGMLKNIVKRVQPKLILTKIVKTDCQSLYKRSQELKKLPKN